MDAERLELPDASVDAVVCRWGLMLMADPAAVPGGGARVLRPGGRLAAVGLGRAGAKPVGAVVTGRADRATACSSRPARAERARACSRWRDAGAAGDAGRRRRVRAASWSTRIPVSWSTPTSTSTGDVQTTLSTAVARPLAPLDDDRRARIRGRRRRAARAPSARRTAGAARRQPAASPPTGRGKLTPPCRSTCEPSRATTRRRCCCPATRCGPGGSPRSSSTTPAR